MLRICTAFVLICLPLAALSGPTGTIRVIDADTWDVGGQRVRLFGIDAPELAQTCKKPDGATWACGAWATEQTHQRYAGHTARCDALDKDRYGRIVARCFVGGQDAGGALVTAGLAYAYRRYSLDYVSHHRSAKVAGRGLHASKMQDPSAFRATRSMASDPAPTDSACRIKGNISSKGQHIYHLPGQHTMRKPESAQIKASGGSVPRPRPPLQAGEAPADR
ncbi:MAG: endonuclease YncB(thermonuclease family) [Paracoccaceae bacterium]|jgi:endonuclease YncB( thermonuclease family)